MNNFISLFLIIISMFVQGHSVFASKKHSSRTYYVNSITGSDDNDGLSPMTAFQSLDKINGLTLKAGEKVLLSKGCSFDGQLEPKGQGLISKPVVIGSYGKGDKPIINGNGEKLHTVLVENVNSFRIKDLTITNKGGKSVAHRRGLIVRASECGEMKNIVLSNLTIRDVNGSLVKSEGGGSGILIDVEWKTKKTRINGLTIENCHIFDCQRNGINFKGVADRNRWYPSLGVVIRSNLLEKIPGDYIVPIACQGAIIENNIVRNAPTPSPMHIQDAAAGIWPWSSDDTVIRYNVAQGMSARWDGQGYDSDYNCYNTIIEYNVSIDNEGGFVLVCNDGSSLGKSWNIGTHNTVFKNNISINDGLRTDKVRSGKYFSPIFHLSGPIKNTDITDNVVVQYKEKPTENVDRTLIHFDQWGNKPAVDVLFADNTFYMEEPLRLVMDREVKKCLFEGNKYFGEIKGAFKPSDYKSRPKADFNLSSVISLEKKIKNIFFKPNQEVIIDNKALIKKTVDAINSANK